MGNQRTVYVLDIYIFTNHLLNTGHMYINLLTFFPLSKWNSFQQYEEGRDFFLYAISSFNLFGHSLIGIIVTSPISAKSLFFFHP